MQKIARREDWKAVAMPACRETIPFRRSYSLEEFARLQVGDIPRSMDDKWFIYYEDPHLFLHRSWTGFCNYVVRFERSGTRIVCDSAEVNRDREQYDSPGVEYDAQRLATVLDSRARPRQQPESSLDIEL